ncbi:MAG: BON domain-containing protein [Gemmataceae bacterium]|nr:BON domain-containing protein [Gemmataceae bacterium]
MEVSASTPSPPRARITVAEVARLVRERVGGRGAGLVVTEQAGGVVLSGRVDCFYVRQLALATVRSIPGVVLLADLIRVGGADSDR